MESTPENMKARMQSYCKRRDMQPGDKLGHGQDGNVYSTNRRTAVKVFKYDELFRRELQVYQRLTERQVFQVEGFAVPRLLGSNAELHVIEMEVVQPPFVVDFAGAYLDRPPDFYSQEDLEDFEREAMERFGNHWDTVQSILATFQGYGIWLMDLKIDNIKFQ
ncbi:hypothetical protein [Planctomicrobium sp. SH664]|uniref:hypothetical protein n=1 Tax=Planctomicrobium sp. SH664 TaxID=3448125 RepID=UPI003F5B7470